MKSKPKLMRIYLALFILATIAAILALPDCGSGSTSTGTVNVSIQKVS